MTPKYPLIELREALLCPQKPLSQSRLALMVGVSLSTIQKWEHGSSTPSKERMAHIVRLAEAHGYEGLEAKWARWLHAARFEALEGGSHGIQVDAR
jgi:transcriptional regulator with XRE-family HTH domain